MPQRKDSFIYRWHTDNLNFVSKLVLMLSLNPSWWLHNLRRSFHVEHANVRVMLILFILKLVVLLFTVWHKHYPCSLQEFWWIFFQFLWFFSCALPPQVALSDDFWAGTFWATLVFGNFYLAGFEKGAKYYWSRPWFRLDRDLWFRPTAPHGCHPLPAINQVRTKVNPPGIYHPPWDVLPHEMCHPPPLTCHPHGMVPPWCVTSLMIHHPPTDMPPPLMCQPPCCSGVWQQGNTFTFGAKSLV